MKIVDKKILADFSGVKLTELEIISPHIAEKARPGQFVVVMVSEEGERVPLTVVRKNKDKGTINIILQEAGFSTKLIGSLNPGDSLYALTGPLGHATEIKDYGKVILIGGGVGIAEIYPVAKSLKEAGNHVTTIIGSRTKNFLILEQELKEASSEFYITTDDGSYERKGFTTDVLRELLSKDTYALVYAVGPIPMMEKVGFVTKEFNTKTLVSLNALMVDGTGMCGCCRVTVDGKTMFACIDGPEFDAHLVDWDEIKKRNKVYENKEQHICKLEEAAKNS